MAAVRGVVSSIMLLFNSGVTHLAVATDHVIIESFRNDLWPGYKTGDGVEPELLAQFPARRGADRSASPCGQWSNSEADDALAAGAAAAARDEQVDRVVICTPDKRTSRNRPRGTRVVQMDRRTRVIRDEAGVILKFGVPPASIPDYLALVGDSADGFPGLQGWGPKSSAAVLAKYGHLENIPDDWRAWGVNAANPASLAATLARDRERALLFRTLATLREDLQLFETIDDLRWEGPVNQRDLGFVHRCYEHLRPTSVAPCAACAAVRCSPSSRPVARAGIGANTAISRCSTRCCLGKLPVKEPDWPRHAVSARTTWAATWARG